MKNETPKTGKLFVLFSPLSFPFFLPPFAMEKIKERGVGKGKKKNGENRERKEGKSKI